VFAIAASLATLLATFTATAQAAPVVTPRGKDR
jgi:hypothetical protein